MEYICFTSEELVLLAKILLELQQMNKFMLLYGDNMAKDKKLNYKRKYVRKQNKFKKLIMIKANELDNNLDKYSFIHDYNTGKIQRKLLKIFGIHKEML